MGASAEEFGRGGLPAFDDAVLDYEVKSLGSSLTSHSRYTLS